MVTPPLAVAALSAASIVFGIAVLNAVNGTIGTAPFNEDSHRPPHETLGPTRDRRLADSAIDFAADHDPFQPNRQRAPDYRLPGDLAQAVPASTGPIVPAPIPFRVVGAIVTELGGVALVAGDSGAPQIVTLGEQIDGYRLTQLEHDAVTFSAPDGTPTRVRISPHGGAVKKIDWATAARNLGVAMGQKATVTCPAGGRAGSIWGSGTYTEDSSICTAAVHAGLITFETGGTFVVHREPGLRSYQGTTQNGVTTSGYGPFGGSFTVSKRMELTDDGGDPATEGPSRPRERPIKQ